MVDVTTPSTNRAPTVCVIGCGPGGMFFCHALEQKLRRMAEDQENSSGSAIIVPRVTVFERADGPGGVWRSERSFESGGEEEEKKVECNFNEQHQTQMYEALWTNGPKEGIEFYDYTYDEHFGHALPVYMPRQALLEYMVARCVKRCPDFFEKYVRFQTSVTHVKYSPEKQKFQVTTLNTRTRETKQHLFDKCVWSAGDNGLPKIPQSLLHNTFSSFPGRIIHSTDTANFAQDVQNKRVLIIGGSYSAEDLALMAIKVGAAKIYIVSRYGYNVVTWAKAWPQNKVEVLAHQTPVSTTGSTIQIKKVKWIDKSVYEPIGDVIAELEDIDTVILCTGYNKQFDMLDEELRVPYKKKDTSFVPVPNDWKMNENLLTKALGDVEPHPEIRWYGTFVSSPEIYNCMLIPNPNMMYLRSNHNDYPILGIDAYAHLLVRYVTGEIPIPSAEQMTQANIDQALHEMSFPYARYYMDKNYRHAWDNSTTESQLNGPGSWGKCMTAFNQYDFNIIARALEQANYPLNIGTYQQLNEKGKALMRYGSLSYYDRHIPETEKEWKTFRDVSREKAAQYVSLHSGTCAVPLPKRWMDIDENEEDVLVLLREQQQQDAVQS